MFFIYVGAASVPTGGGGGGGGGASVSQCSEENTLPGDVVCLISAVLYASYTLLIRKLLLHRPLHALGLAIDCHWVEALRTLAPRDRTPSPTLMSSLPLPTPPEPVG